MTRVHATYASPNTISAANGDSRCAAREYCPSKIYWGETAVARHLLATIIFFVSEIKINILFLQINIIAKN